MLWLLLGLIASLAGIGFNAEGYDILERCYRTGRQRPGIGRFDQAPLTAFSEKLQRQAHILFQELRAYDNAAQPFNLTLASTAEEVRAGLSGFKVRRQNLEQPLRLSRSATAISALEVAEEKSSAVTVRP